MSNDQIKTLLRKHHIVSLIEDDSLDKLIKRMEMVSFSMGEIIISEGEQSECAFLIFSGKVRIFKQGPDGKPITLGTLSRGDLLGEFAIIKQGIRSASVRASEDAVLFRIDYKDFQKLLDDTPELRQYYEKYIQDKSVINFLRLTTFMGSLPPKQVISLLKQLESRSFSKDDLIIKEGDAGDRLYIIKSGEVKVVTDRDGKEVVLNYLVEGDYFGERALILDGPTVASVIATKDTECFSLSRSNFNKLIGSGPKIRKQMLDRIEQYNVGEELERKFGNKPVLKAERMKPAYSSAGKDKDVKGTDEKQKYKRKRRRFRKYPWIRQHDETDCGAACLAMISRYYGVRISVGRLRDIANVGREGASMYSLSAAAEKIGYTSRAVKTNYEYLKKVDLPAVAHWKGYHFIVLYKVRANEVIVGDPGVGLIKISRKEFEDGWTGRLLLLEPTSELDKVEDEKTTFKRFLPFVKPYRILLLEVLMASLILDLLGLASPIFTQTIVDKVLVHQDIKMLNIMLGGMLLVGIFQTLTTLLRQYILIHVSTKLSLIMETDLFKHITRLVMRYFHTRRIGDVLTRFGDINKIQSVMTGTAITAVLDVLMVMVYLSMMFYYNSKLAVVALIFIPMYVILTLVFTPIMKRNNQKIFEKQATTQSKLIESIKSIETIKASTAEMSSRWEYANLMVQETIARFHSAKLKMGMNTVSRMLNIASSTFLLWYGAHLVINGELTVGQLMAFQALVGMVMAPIMGLVGLWGTLQDAMLSLSRLNDIYDAEPEEKPGKQYTELPRIRGHIKFENMSFRYNLDDKDILSNLNLEIQPGETLAIVGRSGSGKTTLISMLLRFYTSTEGRILIDDHDITTVSVGSLRSQIGIVLQETTIFSGTIRENISTTDHEATMDRVISAAKLA